MDVEFSLRWIDVNGVSTRVLEAGDGPPLIVSNGMSGHLECYARTIRGLAPDFRVICYDTIGHGFTDKPNGGTRCRFTRTISSASSTRSKSSDRSCQESL